MAAAILPPISRYDQAEVIACIKQTVAKGASDAQLRMFLEVCKRTGLDPFLKEVWFVPEKSIIMAGRDGYLRIANESANFDGMETRVERDERNVPVKAVCTVWRKDRTHPIICEAYYSEYQKPSPVWKQYPSAMIGKVAEVLALKRSFSINGVVTEEEIGYDGKGSVEAAQEVAKAKIAAVPQRAVAMIEQIPEPQDEDRYTYRDGDEMRELVESPSDLEQELHDSIVMVEQLKTRTTGKVPTLAAMREAFATMYGRYKSINWLKTYYAILGLHGMRESDEFPDTEEGLSAARACYKEMTIDVANRETRMARR